MKKARIKNYHGDLAQYNGQIGVVYGKDENVWQVIMPNGAKLYPYSPQCPIPQCEPVSEESEILTDYEIC